MMQLIEIFQQHDYQVTYSSPAQISEHMVNLDEQGIEKVAIELNNSSFDEFVKVLNPDVVLFDRFMMEEQFSWRVEKQCPSAFRLLETVDLHCLRYARQQAVKQHKDASKSENLDYVNDIALREVASILRCDLSLLISEYEIEVLKDVYHVDEDILHYLPFMFDVIEEDKAVHSWPAFSERQHFVTIGNFRHEPNWDSVLYLKNAIWPAVRKALKNAELHIYGSYPPKKAQQLHNSARGFHIKGWAEDAIATLSQYRVCLSPLRFGAGMKGKLADAMLSGTPSVTTSIGAESMHTGYDWPGVIADEPELIIAEAIELYSDQANWKKCQLNGIPIVNNLFNKKKNAQVLYQKLLASIESQQARRNKNFTGMMLRHHTMKSAQYMSQWIEAKNRLKDKE